MSLFGRHKVKIGKTSIPKQYHATYAVGKLTDLTFEAEYISELDQGFDFYAPQTRSVWIIKPTQYFSVGLVYQI